ncbi:unnamed protein product [Prorocentrum cordatum]|uniref:Ubiquitin-like domain-containing protein n=1 Tax=Prorocentrum cordatum TaxID=2364126 RepID=A0ABN9R827_9DINO|nr:unnamed protein product [Polarella glacialis]
MSAQLARPLRQRHADAGRPWRAAGAALDPDLPGKKPISLDTQAESTIDPLKLLIQDREGVPPDEQRLIYAGRQMEPGRKLNEYNVQDEVMIFVTFRLHGGMQNVDTEMAEDTEDTNTGLTQDTATSGLTQTLNALGMEDSGNAVADPSLARTLAELDAIEVDEEAVAIAVAAAAAAGPATLPPGLPAPGVGSARPGLPAPSPWESLIENEILQHFELAQAARSVHGPMVAPRSLDSRAEFANTLRLLAYAPSAADAWNVLGLSSLEGPDLSLNTIEARLRFAKLLGSMIDGATWPQADKTTAQQDIQSIEAAAATCFASFDTWVRERKRMRPSKLPLWRELGGQALKAVLGTAPRNTEVACTQWSSLLDISAIDASLRGRVAPVDEARLLADLAEKGDASFWDTVQTTGRPISFWAPANAAALGRLLSALLRRSTDRVPCEYVRIIAPLDLFPGCATVESICDLWWHDLLGEKWTALRRRVDFHPQPMEFVSPGPAGPRHELRGLAVFTISTSLVREPPKILDLESPVVTAAPLPTYLVDFPSTLGAEFMTVLCNHLGHSPKIGRIYRSPGHTAESPRGRVEVRFTSSTSRLNQEAVMRHARQILPTGVCFASQDLYTEPGSLIAELGHADVIASIWALCSGALFLSKSTLLLTTEATASTWQQAMDTLMRNDPDSAVYKLKWRPSRHGGRPFASPSALPARIAATRRTKQTRGTTSTVQAITDVEIKGHLHADEHALIRDLVTHLVGQTGISLTELQEDRGRRAGKWQWLAADDPAAPPGRFRLYLKDLEEVAKVRDTLHDKAVKVGMDTFRVQVFNDLEDRVSGAAAAR